jgi:hypothetical protein
LRLSQRDGKLIVFQTMTFGGLHISLSLNW